MLITDKLQLKTDMWKWISLGLAFALIASNSWWLYQALDNAATQKYVDMEIYENRNRIKMFRALTSSFVKGKNVSEIEGLTEQLFPDSISFVKEGFLNVGFIAFELDNNKIVSVK